MTITRKHAKKRSPVKKPKRIIRGGNGEIKTANIIIRNLPEIPSIGKTNFEYSCEIGSETQTGTVVSKLVPGESTAKFPEFDNLEAFKNAKLPMEEPDTTTLYVAKINGDGNGNYYYRQHDSDGVTLINSTDCTSTVEYKTTHLKLVPYITPKESESSVLAEEATRITAEEAKKKEEEANRIAAEEAEKKAEADRIAAEEAEKKAEADRIAAEEAKKKEEEAARIASEAKAARNAEAARIAAEAKAARNAEAEAARIAEEKARAEAMEQRLAELEKIRQKKLAQNLAANEERRKEHESQLRELDEKTNTLLANMSTKLEQQKHKLESIQSSANPETGIKPSVAKQIPQITPEEEAAKNEAIRLNAASQAANIRRKAEQESNKIMNEQAVENKRKAEEAIAKEAEKQAAEVKKKAIEEEAPRIAVEEPKADAEKNAEIKAQSDQIKTTVNRTRDNIKQRQNPEKTAKENKPIVDAFKKLSENNLIDIKVLVDNKGNINTIYCDAIDTTNKQKEPICYLRQLNNEGNLEVLPKKKNLKKCH